MTDSANKLRSLLQFAETGGAPASFLATVARELLEDRVELLQLRRLVNPRRLARIEKAERMRRALEQGANPGLVRKRFGLKRSAFYRLLELSREVRDTSALGSAPGGHMM